MAKTITLPGNHLANALRVLMDGTAVPCELLAFLTKMVYFMHTIRVGEEDADEGLTGMAGDNTDCIYAALLLVENLVPAWYNNAGEEPSEGMIEELAKVLDMGGIELWTKMITQFRFALAADISQGTHQMLIANLLEYYTAFNLTISHCEAYLNATRPQLKAA